MYFYSGEKKKNERFYGYLMKFKFVIDLKEKIRYILYIVL